MTFSESIKKYPEEWNKIYAVEYCLTWGLYKNNKEYKRDLKLHKKLSKIIKN